MRIDQKKLLRTLAPRFLKNKKIFMRVDFNIESFKEISSFLQHPRIRKTLPTINFLLKTRPQQVILISHRGQPQGRERKFSLKLIYRQLRRIYKDLAFAEHLENLGSARIVLVENIRFFKGETENDSKFGRKLANLADIYINDAFSTSHRSNASIAQVPKYLPSFAGFLFEEELKNLSLLLKPKHPYIAIVGGAKISTKLPLLKNLLKKADGIILGGALVNSILFVLGFEIGQSLAEKGLTGVKQLFRSKKIILPTDFYVLYKREKHRRFLGNIQHEDKIYDIGPASLIKFFQTLRSAKTIVWNGPIGLFEDKRFSQGTFALAEYLAGLWSSRAKARGARPFRVVGGGETEAVLEYLKLTKHFDFVSTGGGAMLEFLAGKKLPGIEALQLIKAY